MVKLFQEAAIRKLEYGTSIQDLLLRKSKQLRQQSIRLTSLSNQAHIIYSGNTQYFNFELFLKTFIFSLTFSFILLVNLVLFAVLLSKK